MCVFVLNQLMMFLCVSVDVVKQGKKNKKLVHVCTYRLHYSERNL